MTTNKVTWTELGLKKLTAPKDRRFVDHVDPNNKGLCLRVSQTGGKSWSVLYRVVGEGKPTATGRPRRGKQKRITLGTFPHLSLQSAQKHAREIKDLADSGICAKAPSPEPEPKPKEDRKPTLARVVVKFLRYKKADGLKSHLKMRSMFRMHILAQHKGLDHLGPMVMDDIRQSHIMALLDHYDLAGKQGTANEMQKYIRAVWGFAYARDLVGRDVTKRIDRKIKHAPRERHLEADELAKVWAATLNKGFPPPDRQFVQVLILSGLRKNELAKARWDDLDPDRRALKLSADRTKTGKEMIHPLSDWAWDILHSVPRVDDCPFIFSKNHKVAMSVDSKLLVKLRKLAGDVDHFTLHDFRRVCRSAMGAAKVAPHVAEYALGHLPQGMVKVYDRHDYLDERRDAFAQYADWVKGVVDG